VALQVGANYRAAARAKSRADFVSKMGTVEEDSDESLYWMELLMESGLVDGGRLADLMAEGNEILAQMESEQRVKEKGQWMWKQIGSRPNHLLDAEVMQVVAATMLKIIGREAVAAAPVDTPDGEP
jgi:hypothetical protein